MIVSTRIEHALWYMTTRRKEIMNEAYDGALVSTGVVAVSMIGKKIVGEGLGTPDFLKGTTKLALAIASEAVL